MADVHLEEIGPPIPGAIPLLCDEEHCFTIPATGTGT